MVDNKKVQNNKQSRKKKILLGCLFGILGGGVIATSIAIPLSYSKKEEDKPIPPTPTKTITLTNNDFVVQNNEILFKNDGSDNLLDFSKGTQVNITFDANFTQGVEIATHFNAFILEVDPETGAQNNANIWNASLPSIKFGNNEEQFSQATIMENFHAYQCSWNSNYSQAIVTISFYVIEDITKTGIIAFRIE